MKLHVLQELFRITAAQIHPYSLLFLPSIPQIYSGNVATYVWPRFRSA